MYRTLGLVVCGSLLVGSGCAPEEIDGRAGAIGGVPVDGLLDLVNDRDNTTLERLDVDCAIRSDSAKQIIRHRDGRDKTPGTADDDPFDDLAELDDVSMVGPWTLERLTTCAWLFGYMKGAGPTLSGTGRARLDGFVAPGEWDDAGTVELDVELPEGGFVPATLHVMNDGERLQLAVAFADDLSSRYLRFSVLFDDDSDGFVESGEDRVAAVYRPSSRATQFGDAHVGAPAERAGDWIASFLSDASVGGSDDGGATAGTFAGTTSIELWHPLDSADDAHDLSLAPGDSVGFSFAVAVLGDEWTESRSWATVAVAEPPPVVEEVPWSLPQDLLDQLAAIAEGYREPDVYFEMRLSEQLAYVVDGIPQSYKVIFVQTIDPEGGIQLVVEFELDAAYNVISENVYI